MSDGEVEPVGHLGPDLAKVMAEMDEIFVQADWGQSAPRPPWPALTLPSFGGGRPAAILLTALAAGALGFGAGAWLTRGPGKPDGGRAEFRAGDQSQAQAQAQARVQPPPLPQSPATPPVQLAEAAPAPLPATPPANLSPPVKPSPAPATAHPKAHARSRTKSPAADGPRAATAAPHVRVRRASLAMAQPASCQRDAQGEECRNAVIQADQHLRNVYDQAARRGVSQDVLVDYRRRWAALRDQRSGEPSRLIEGYGAMAYDLGRESTR